MRKQLLIASFVTVLLMLALSAWAWVQLPVGATVPVHWNIAGEVDRFGGKAEGLLLIPAILIGIAALFYFLPLLDPQGQNILRSFQAYRALWIVMLLFFLGLHIATTLIALGYRLRIEQILLPGLGIMFMVIGNYMGKIRQNYTMGIRTPWTLHSEQIWNKTHRVGGWLFVGSGLITLLASFLSPQIAVVLLIVSISIAAIGPILYSYLLYRREMVERANN